MFNLIHIFLTLSANYTADIFAMIFHINKAHCDYCFSAHIKRLCYFRKVWLGLFSLSHFWKKNPTVVTIADNFIEQSESIQQDEKYNIQLQEQTARGVDETNTCKDSHISIVVRSFLLEV